MPRCKALARGGSRRCKRNALKGSEFCSFHGGLLHAEYRDNRSKSSHSVGSASVRPTRTTSASHPPGLPSHNAPGGPSIPTGDRRFNVRGLGIAYRNHIIRTLKEIPHTLLGVGTVEMSARSTAHPTIARNVGYRYALRPFMGVSGGLAMVSMATEYHADLAEGQFPGTDESIFI